MWVSLPAPFADELGEEPVCDLFDQVLDLVVSGGGAVRPLGPGMTQMQYPFGDVLSSAVHRSGIFVLGLSCM